MAGKFIVIEGLDGSSKSTQSNELYKKLSQNHNVWLTRECTNGPIGEITRSLYLTGKRKVDISTINLLMAADRLDHLTNEDGIIAHIDKDEIVICDRYVLSAIAYDNYMHAYNTGDWYDNANRTIGSNKKALDLISPDLTIFIDMKPEVCLKRINERNEDKSVYEDLDKLKMIQSSYFNAIEILDMMEYNHNIRVVEADERDSIEVINDRILSIISEELGIY